MRLRVFNDRANHWGPVLALGLVLVLWAGVRFGPGAAWSVLGAGCLAVACGVVVARTHRGQPNPVERWAAAHGWDYDRTSTAVPLSGRDVLRTITGGVSVTSYTTTAAPDMTGETATAPRHAVCAIVPADLPSLLILPEALARRPGAAPLAPDIQFESAAFNARWRVHCADATFAHAFCHPRVMERLMRADARGVSLLVEGRDVVVHAPGPTELDAVEPRAALAADLVRLVPPYLVARYPARTRRKRHGPERGNRPAAALTLLMLAGAATLLVPMAREGGSTLVLAVAYGVGLVALAVMVVRSELVDRRKARAEERHSPGEVDLT